MKHKILRFFLVFVLSVVLVFSVTACSESNIDNGGGNKGDTEQDSNNSSGDIDDSGNENKSPAEKLDYDMSGIEFSGKSIVYDGNYHSIEIIGALPQGVSVSYNGGGTNAGVYNVTAKFTGDTLTHNSIPNMSAKLTIVKATFNGDITFEDKQIDYDGNSHNIEISGEVPDEINIIYTYANEYGEEVPEGNVKEPGKYTVTAKFSSENYEPITELTAVLKINGEFIYTLDKNGKKVWDYLNLADALTDWLDINAFWLSLATECKVKNICFIEVSDEEFNFCANMTFIYDTHTVEAIQGFKAKNALLNKLSAGDLKTKKDLINYLDENRRAAIGMYLIQFPDNYNAHTEDYVYEYSTFDDDYVALHKEEFEAMSASVINRISNEIEGADTAKILFGFKTQAKVSDIFIGGSLFGALYWNFCYIIEIDGDVKLIYVKEILAPDAPIRFGMNAVQHVINNTEYWKYAKILILDLDNKNSDLYL